jgi:cation diffusion facilitator family transporter
MKKEANNKFLPNEGIELPDSLKPVMEKARKLEIITVIYLISVIVVIYFTLSSSQAMKAAWLEDMLSLIPSVLFIIAHKHYNRNPTKTFPYGFHRAFGIAFTFGSFALIFMGVFIVYDSTMALINLEHPTIGHIKLFGVNIWFGWIMILSLLYSFIPAVILGRKKLPLAKKLHNKLLIVDAMAQKADWMTAAAAILGIIGIGFGLWWADAVAAIFISVSILKDGYKNSKDAIGDLLGQIPTHIDSQKPHKLNNDLVDILKREEWIVDFRIRLREEGQVFLGEAFVIVKSEENLVENISNCFYKIKKHDWKLHEVLIQPVKDFENL